MSVSTESELKTRTQRRLTSKFQGKIRILINKAVGVQEDLEDERRTADIHQLLLNGSDHLAKWSVHGHFMKTNEQMLNKQHHAHNDDNHDGIQPGINVDQGTKDGMRASCPVGRTAGLFM